MELKSLDLRPFGLPGRKNSDMETVLEVTEDILGSISTFLYSQLKISWQYFKFDFVRKQVGYDE